jgi:hypothetical protein
MIKQKKISNYGFCPEGQEKAFGKTYRSYVLSNEAINPYSKCVYVAKKNSWFDSCYGLYFSFKSPYPQSYVGITHKRFDSIINELNLSPVRNFISKRKQKMKNSGVYKLYIAPVPRR